ncbi:hypothetical protein BJ912DRAFT_563044 [Pholiota molesta]|nr:hypothetical protein BJ912DRAFT_563044 [Pholiota molesta]
MLNVHFVNTFIAAARPYLSDSLHLLPPVVDSSGTISTTVVQGILVIRVWVLYQRNMIAFYIAFFFYIGGTATLIGITIKDYVGEEVLLDTTLSDLPGCYAKSVPSIIAGTWIGPLIVEMVLFISVVSRGFYWWREGISVPSIFMLLARDSTLYFTVIFALLLANYLVFQFAPPALAGLLVTPAATTGCILGSQMMIHMRTMAEHTGIPTITIPIQYQ